MYDAALNSLTDRIAVLKDAREQVYRNTFRVFGTILDVEAVADRLSDMIQELYAQCDEVIEAQESAAS